MAASFFLSVCVFCRRRMMTVCLSVEATYRTRITFFCFYLFRFSSFTSSSIAKYRHRVYSDHHCPWRFGQTENIDRKRTGRTKKIVFDKLADITQEPLNSNFNFYWFPDKQNNNNKRQATHWHYQLFWHTVSSRPTYRS